MTTPPDGVWRAAYLQIGGPDPRQGPGWYATHSPTPAEPVAGEKRGLVLSFVGPFEDEAAARVYCDARNPPGTSSAPVDPMREAGRRAGMRAEEEFWRAFLGGET